MPNDPLHAIEVIPIRGLPEFREGDDLTLVLAAALRKSKIALRLCATGRVLRVMDADRGGSVVRR